MTAWHVLRSTDGAGPHPGHRGCGGPRAGRGRGVGHVRDPPSPIADGGGNLGALPGAAPSTPQTLAGVVDLGFTSGSLRDLHGASARRRQGQRRGSSAGTSATGSSSGSGTGRPSACASRRSYERPLGFGEVVLPAGVLRGARDRHARRRRARQPSRPVSTKSGARDRALPTLKLDARPGVRAWSRARGTLDDLRARPRGRSRWRSTPALRDHRSCSPPSPSSTRSRWPIAERGRELALLRLVGATRRQLTRMIRAETLIVAVFGTTLGTLIAAPALAVFSHGLTGSAVPWLCRPGCTAACWPAAPSLPSPRAWCRRAWRSG